MRRTGSAGAFFLALAWLSPSASANDYFVATSGNDGSPGTLESPWQKVSTAAQRAQAGDTLFLLDGTWQDDHVVFANSGTATNPIKLTAHDGTPTLDGMDMTGDGITINRGSHIEISGIAIKNYERGIYVEAGNGTVTGVTIVNNKISDIFKSAVILRRESDSTNAHQNADISFNTLSNTNTWGDFETAAIQLAGVSGSAVKNNTIVNTSNGCGIGGGSAGAYDTVIEGNYIEKAGGQGAITFYRAAGVIVKNNRLVDGTNRGIRFDYHCKGNYIIENYLENIPQKAINLYPDTSTVVTDNIIIDSGRLDAGGIVDTVFLRNMWIRSPEAIIGGQSRNVTFKNNNLVDIARGFFFASEGPDQALTDSSITNNIFSGTKAIFSPGDHTGLVFDYNSYDTAPAYGDVVPGAHNMEADPLFADPLQDDYHLQSQVGRWNGKEWVVDAATSPVIDRGDPADDYSREPNPNGGRIDIGAYGNTCEASKSPAGDGPLGGGDCGPGDKTLGMPCSAGAECLSGNCTAGPAGKICCLSSCNGPCDSGKCGGDGASCDPHTCPPPASACQLATCNAISGCNAASGAACDDGDSCTTSDVCDASGVCRGAAKDCAALDRVCAVGVCDSASGACISEAVADGTACDSGNACLSGEVCMAGQCTGGKNTCSDGVAEGCSCGGNAVPSAGLLLLAFPGARALRRRRRDRHRGHAPPSRQR